jgi:hypothetical protein
MKRTLLAVALTFCATPLAAQVDVGTPPTRSPFRDLEFRQELTAFGGYFIAAKDPAGVAPRSAPMEGLRYEIVIGGPVELFARVARVNSERLVINPLEPRASREVGVQSWPVYLTDLGFALNLTGQRSWHGVVPVVHAGVGIASDLDKKASQDQFNVGTTFAFSFGGGLRIVPGGRFQLRADVGTWMYEYKYPATYYATTSDNTTVLPDDQAKNFWKKNLGLTLGASYLLFR